MEILTVSHSGSLNKIGDVACIVFTTCNNYWCLWGMSYVTQTTWCHCQFSNSWYGGEAGEFAYEVLASDEVKLGEALEN